MLLVNGFKFQIWVVHRIYYLLGGMDKAVGKMVVVGLLGSERVKTTVANEGFAVVFISTTDQAGHVLNPGIMLSGRVILVPGVGD